MSVIPNRELKKAMDSEVTERDGKFLKYFSAVGFDLSRRGECAEAAGYPARVSRSHASRLIRSLANNKRMQRAMKKHNINFDKLAEKLGELLEAEHPMKEGRPDNLVQHKALETAVRLLDAEPPKKLEVDQTNRQEVIISAELVSRIERFQKIKETAVDVEPAAISE